MGTPTPEAVSTILGRNKVNGLCHGWGRHPITITTIFILVRHLVCPYHITAHISYRPLPLTLPWWQPHPIKILLHLWWYIPPILHIVPGIPRAYAAVEEAGPKVGVGTEVVGSSTQIHQDLKKETGPRVPDIPLQKADLEAQDISNKS